MAHGLENIDWQAPWLAHLRKRGEAAANGFDESTDIYSVLNDLIEHNPQTKTAVKFVPQVDLPIGTPYESCIFDLMQCPTRNNLHDFFNGLVWLHFPKIKQRLNQLHAQEIELSGSVTQRGKVRDALTLLDENGAFLFAPEPLWNALLRRDWHHLFIELRPLWPKAKLVLFGHALMEKLVVPRKAITAHVYIIDTPNLIANYTENTTDDGTFLSYIDEIIAADMTAEKFAAKPFSPLPVMGVPGWCAASENPDFYTDSHVFRRPTSYSA